MLNIPEFKFALREDLQDKPEFLPTRSELKATGWDIRCAEPEGLILKPFEKYKIRLGFRMFAPDGFWMELKPRSSSYTKKHLNFLYGTIDEAFNKEMLAAFQYIPGLEYKPVWDFTTYPNRERITHYNCSLFKDVLYPDNAMRIEFGERIGQLIPVRRQEMVVTAISNKEYDAADLNRGAQRDGGFGSTGDK